MRLEAEQLKIALHTALGNAGLGGHRAHAPMRGAVRRFGVQRGVDQMGYALVVDRARCAWSNVVIKAGDAALDEASASLTHGGLGQLEPPGDLNVGLAIGTAENDPRPATQRRWQRAAAGERKSVGWDAIPATPSHSPTAKSSASGDIAQFAG